ncbi:hypothetical protein HDF16_003111 [Granulicella aggregans]|uniref:GmrSD restriction endonucleases N-terminal domain-containing protein n=1 Tax=Granulicella aggregans TaxID=474949 RepID=A0A7W8E495_9BACT|nr:DUF262 domain-containing protein [Granulicella aggregans]MBB5058397.1 hypothetical protein [Granulicella aggregans]
MSTLRTYPLANSAILRLNSERAFINAAPDYQRDGDVWTLEKKQLLIDSIINDYDIPKLYFHALSPTQKSSDAGKFDYAIIDGRQRLETIWSFIDGKFALADDFIYFADPKSALGGLTYTEIADLFPRIKIRFDSYSIPVVCVETEDIDLIEDMFSRLNEAVPLNAAEKRSAIGGPMGQAIKDVAVHPFFLAKVRFSDSRYRHREVAARLLFLEYSREIYGKILDTKKPYLDDMVRKAKSEEYNGTDRLLKKVLKTLNVLSPVFTDRDYLLRSQAIVPVLYLTAELADELKTIELFQRNKISEFYERLEVNRRAAESDISKADFELLEFDRMSQQGTNDAASIRERARILADHLHINKTARS